MGNLQLQFNNNNLLQLISHLYIQRKFIEIKQFGRIKSLQKAEMSSFIQTTQQTTTDVQDKNNKIFSQLKTYTFFVFYELSLVQRKNISILQKINFSLKEDKYANRQVNATNAQKSKQIQIHFYDLDNHSDILHAISDVRAHSFQNKAKIVINANQEKLGYLLEEFQKMNVDIGNISIVINSNHFQSDLSTFLGWKDKKQSMAIQSLHFYHVSSQQWIKSSAQKIDVWQCQISVSGQKGQILKVLNNKLTPLAQNQKTLKQYFISHFCIGYHASLLLKCKQKIKSEQGTLTNSFVSMMERFKKFCCVGQKGIKATTGIANITLVDEKGEDIQILKQLKPGDCGEQQSQVDLTKTNKCGQYKDVLSILLTNLNLYQNDMLEKSIPGKINDGKLQLITFESRKNHRKICSSPGMIRIKLQTPSVDVQIGQSFYRLQHPQQIKISFAKKIKVGIHNQLVKC